MENQINEKHENFEEEMNMNLEISSVEEEMIDKGSNEEQNEENELEKKEPKQKSILKKTLSIILDWIIALIIALVILLVFNMFIMEGKVSGESMMATYHDGERVWINKHPQKIEVGDVIIFWADKYEADVAEYKPGRFENAKKFWLKQDDLKHEEFHIKRVVAEPGGHVEVRDNFVYVNGELVGGSNILYVEDAEYDLADDEYFVMGDNYGNSKDSRIDGPIKEQDIYGKVINGKPDANSGTTGLEES